MFASQLLRILQTLPADAKYESCDTAELKLRMKENQNGTHRHSDGYCEERDSLSFTTKDLSHSNGHGKDVDPLALQEREGDDFWNTPELECSAVIDDLTKDTKTGIRVSPKEDQNGLLYHLSGCKKDADPLECDRKDRDELWDTPELECSMIINDFSSSNKNETRDSGAPFITSSELFPSDAHLCTDKNVMDCELPELIVCYKEINYHVVKDICIDEGVPDEGKGLTDLRADHCAGLCVSKRSNESRQNETSGGLDFTMFIPDGSKASSEEDIDDHATDERGTKDEGDVVSLVPGKLNCFQEGGISKDGRSPEDSTQACETKCTPNKIENGLSEEESIVTSMLPLKKFGTRSFLRSFMDSLNNDKDEVAQLPNQSPLMEANLESLDAVSKSEESNKNGPANKLVYDSKVEIGTITFDFNSSKPAAADSWGRSVETIEQSLNSDNALNHSDGNIDKPIATNNPFIVSEVQSTSMDGSTENNHEETVLNHKKGNSTNPFAVGEVQSIVIDGSTVNIDQISVLNRKKGNFNPFAIGEIETAIMNKSTEVIQLPPVLSAKKGNSNNPFAVGEVQKEQPVLNHEIGKTTNPFAVSEVQSSSMARSIESIHQQPELKHKNSTSNNPFAIEEVQNATIDGSTGNIHEKPLKLDEIPDRKDGTDKSSSTINQVQSASSMAGNSKIAHEQPFEPRILPNHEGTTNNISFTDQGQCVDGEASFSAASAVSGLITYSGPITHSGDTSLRSDSSTTSTRSFAFPVLQSEWNSSPVRMEKADRQHFRKHRGWKQGILCCRF